VTDDQRPNVFSLADCVSGLYLKARGNVLRLKRCSGQRNPKLPMITHAKLRDIPKAELNRLTAEAYRRSPGLRTIRIITFLIPFFTYISISRELAATHDPYFRIMVGVPVALIVSAVIWTLFGSRRLMIEIRALRKS
jgi:hypothetical protein